MNSSILFRARCCALAAVLLTTVFRVDTHAQAAPGGTSTTPAADEKVQLNVFEVTADRDDSYGALNSNSITRFNTELARLPISADIYNEAFMRDINAST